MKLKNKVALITGAGNGFGKAIAILFASEGAEVIVADIDIEAAILVAKEICSDNGKATPLFVDVASNTHFRKLVDEIITLYSRIDIVVNNAGTTHKNQPMLDVNEEEFQRVFDVNVKSIYLSAKHVLPVFKRQKRGVMVNIGSTAGIRPRPGLVWYNATKGAVITMTKSMAIELAPENIRVVAVNPVIGETNLLPKFLPGNDNAEIRKKMIETIPLGRMSTPLDIAYACLFLASDDAKFLTGSTLEVDGGRCI